MSELRNHLKIGEDHVNAINDFLLDPTNDVINRFLAIVERYGGPEEINRKAREARRLENLISRLKAEGSPYLADIEWLIKERDAGSFIPVADYRRKILGDAVETMTFNEDSPVTLEISSLQFFPWLIAQAQQAIRQGDLMPGRFIRVRSMKEQVADNGDTLAVAAATPHGW